MSRRAFPFPMRPAAALLLGLAGGLSACGSDGPKFAPACPQTGILSDAADLTVFRGAGTDLTDMVVDGRITGVNGKCSPGDPGHLRTVLAVNLDLARGPALQGRASDVTYFVSVSRGNTILTKEMYSLHVTFGANGGTRRLTADPVQIDLPTPDKVLGSDYTVLIGFQLTPEQLAFNRRRGPR